MKITDRKIIEFLYKSPIKSFTTIRDTLSYLNSQWILEDIEYELFNWALGDNINKKITIKVPILGVHGASLLFILTQHARDFHLIKRRTKKLKSPSGDPNELDDISITGHPHELNVFYCLTSSGKEMLKILESIEKAKEEINK